MGARLLIIALDGADATLLERWSADGTLPHLAALRARGGARKLSAPAGITDDALWASFQYSVGLGGHGRYHWQQRLDSGKMDMAYVNEIDRTAFWDSLSSQGMRVAVFDVPKCGLPRPMNGIHLADWLVHGRYFSEPKSYPASLAADVVRQFGPAPPSRCGFKGPAPNDAQLREVIANLRISIARKRDASLHYLASETWDLFVMAFKEAHCAGHQLWDLADPGHGDHDSAQAAAGENPYRTILTELDAAVGDLTATAGQNAAIAVFTTSEMEPNATLDHLMPEIVTRMNRRLGPTFLTRAVRRIMRLMSTAPPAQPCELLPYNENCTALRVHPRPAGDPRVKAEMLDEIESMLRELVDADTGQSVVATVERPSSNYDGPRATALPDLLIVYSAGTFPRAVTSPRLGRIEAERPSVRPGNHASGGFVIFAGDSFADVKTMADFGPTTAKLLQVAT